MVLKGTEVAPLSSFLFAEAAAEAGLPDGVFNLVSGTGPEIGEAIATHPLIDIVSLTGSVRAGSRVMELASRSVKRVALELGGKSANLILEDADLEKAVTDGLTDAFRNAGQVCGGPLPHAGPAVAAGRGRGDRRGEGGELRHGRPLR